MIKTITKAPIIGLVRYSQFATFYKKKSRNVFEAEYFEYRFNIFQNITLKSFQQQTNLNFILLLLHSENMPTDYKNRFLELERRNPFLYNVFSEDTVEANKEAIRSSLKYALFENDAAITFRIDNDDAVPTDFIQRLSHYLHKAFIGHAISMPRISIIKRISEKQYMLEERTFPAHTIGLAYVTNKEDYRTIMNLGMHTFINETTPMILTAVNLTTQLQTINGENEKNALDETNAKTINEVDLDKYLKEWKLGILNLECLHTLPPSWFPYKKWLKLLIPPLFFQLLRK